jgi:hypothetical protein
MASLIQTYKRSPSMVFRKVADEYLLVPVARSSGDMNALYMLDTVGCYIWEQLDGNRPLQAVLDQIINEFAVEDADAERDLLEFITQLIEVAAVEEVRP